MTEEELILKASSGDNEAIEEVISKYDHLVVILSRKYFLINLEASDLEQEGRIGLFKAIKTYNKDKGSFKTYATLCIKRAILSALVKNNRQKNMPLNTYLSINNQGKILLTNSSEEDDEEEEAGFYLVSSSPSPEENVIFKEERGLRLKEIDEILSPFEKEVLSMFLGGKNYIEIALSLKKEPKSIDNALSRIKIKLRSLKEV